MGKAPSSGTGRAAQAKQGKTAKKKSPSKAASAKAASRKTVTTKAKDRRNSKATPRRKPGKRANEVTKGGSRVLRHAEAAPGQFPPVQLTEKQADLIERHVAKHMAPVANVLHEILSFGLHLDVLCVGATKKFPYKGYVTMGMSAVPMNLGNGKTARAELCVVLPKDWPDADAPEKKGRKHFWPIQWLKNLARLPSDFDTFLDFGHTIPNGDPPEPLEDGCKFVGWLVDVPSSMPEAFDELRSPRFRVHFFQIFPLYQEEMDLKLEEGHAALGSRFVKSKMKSARMCDVHRENVALRK